MNIDQQLDKLKQIRKVDSPPFLFTRIRAGIEAAAAVSAPMKWKLAFAGTAILLMALNAGMLFRSGEPESKIEQLANAMQLSGSNELYHD